ncbi:hypothetical protein GBA63_22405 (plasmid) [Rubrobacter tropicus]|uniref:Uncharacterized protein n=1 Tax=Rubrobacter tropicus TaxID=2653851 RepID=A0A6G8QG13_9ACTN|nr:hypothetical protein [Rubrobacter tropicus]QIN85456.1 hypothetical protein GBA63_22405 [Rubrobacter tropicus]
MRKDQREGLKGARIELAYGEGRNAEPALYTLGDTDAVAERMIADEQESFTVKSGELLTASGHHFYALMELDASFSYENWGCGVAIGPAENFRLLWQGEDDFEAWIAKTKGEDPDFEFFPYRCCYFDRTDAERDHHVGDDGWSLTPGSPPPPLPPDF